MKTMTIRYYFRPGDNLVQLHDSFLVTGIRLSLRGATLEVQCAPEQASQAADLAMRYAESLRTHLLFWGQLLTEEQFASLPAESITVKGRSTRDLALDPVRLRDARRQMVQGTRARLSRCYDYMQEAKDDPKNAAFYIYKLVETIEAEYGGERAAIQGLGDVAGLIKRLKQMANNPDGDQRHAPTDPGVAKPLDEAKLSGLLRDAHALLTMFEAAVRVGP